MTMTTTSSSAWRLEAQAMAAAARALREAAMGCPAGAVRDALLEAGGAWSACARLRGER